MKIFHYRHRHLGLGLVAIALLVASASLNVLVSTALKIPVFWWALAFYLPVVIYVLAFLLFSIFELRITLSAEGITYHTAIYSLTARWENIIRAEQGSFYGFSIRTLVISQPAFQWDPWFGFNYRYSPFRKRFLKRFRRRIPIGSWIWEDNRTLEQLINQHAPHILL